MHSSSHILYQHSQLRIPVHSPPWMGHNRLWQQVREPAAHALSAGGNVPPHHLRSAAASEDGVYSCMSSNSTRSCLDLTVVQPGGAVT
jgi:hypothetical protein